MSKRLIKELYDKRDLLFIVSLLIVCLIIFFPILTIDYAYVDDYVGLWHFNIKDSGSWQTLLQYGRIVTGKLAEWLFGAAEGINNLRSIRIFSLAGWLLSIPIWYFIVKNIVKAVNLSQEITFLSTLYLICLPTVAISIGWAACFELFIANTLGLLSGYLLYKGIRYNDGFVKVSSFYFIASMLIGVISLFTYQTGFGCFLLPFILIFIADSKLNKTVVIGLVSYLLICLIYYLIYRYLMKTSGTLLNGRTTLHINVGNKLKFFLARPLSQAFHFTYLFNEKNIFAVILSGMTISCWLIFSYLQRKQLKRQDILRYFAVAFLILMLVYLPLLIVKENYASSRTMLALKMAAFYFAAQTLLSAFKQNTKLRYSIIGLLSVLFITNAWFNFNKQFLQPIAHENKVIRNYFETNYRKGIDTVFFLGPEEEFYVKKYGITRSWDEFGVPSTFRKWTSEFFFKQLVFEKTGNRDLGEKLTTINSFNKDSLLKTTTISRNNIMFIDAEKVINEN